MAFEPPTILSILNKTTAYLQQKQVPEAKLSAEWLLADVLNCKRLDLYLKFENVLTEEQLNTLRPLVKRRGLREPLEYILGYTQFGPLHMKVTPDVLIPRPETEELCDLIVKENTDTGVLTILDLGTGSGAIALYLARELPQAHITAVDISAQSLQVAQENAIQNQLEGRVLFKESSWFDKLKGSFDIIVSNPPYLTRREWSTAEPEVKEHEPQGALVPHDQSAEGISDLITILHHAKRFLKPSGSVYLETGITQHEQLIQTAKEAGYAHYESLQDLSGRDRFFRAWEVT